MTHRFDMTWIGMEPWRLFWRAFTKQLEGPYPARYLSLVLGGLLVSWWFYVPLHELLHALGCWMGGGTVESLEIAPLYGGQVLSNWFPFIVGRSQYAGRLTGFDTGGSDWVYGLTIALPFVLLLPGWLLLRVSAAKGARVLFGVSLPLALSPLVSLTGDFFELSSLLLFQAWPGPENSHRSLISDDLFRLLGEKAAMGGLTLGVAAFLTLSTLGAVALAGLSVWMGSWLGGLPWKARSVFTGRAGSQ